MIEYEVLLCKLVDTMEDLHERISTLEKSVSEIHKVLESQTKFNELLVKKFIK